MSGSKNGDDLQDGVTESPIIDKPVEKKRYPFQTTQRRNNPVKIKSKTTENLIDNNQSESKKNFEILTPVVNEEIGTDNDSHYTVKNTRNKENKDSTLQIDSSKREELDLGIIPQATETLMKNQVELDPIEVSANSEIKTKIQRKDLTENEIDEICRDRDGRKGSYTKIKTPGTDPRFQQQNQTMRCFVMYTDFYRCENILGEGEIACQWFKDVFTSICPLDWIRRWDEARAEGRFGWPKGKTQGKFPGSRYGV